MILSLIVMFPAKSFGADVEKIDDSYMAKVGNLFVTAKEFNEAIAKLHTSNRVGEVIEKYGPNTGKLDYRKYLNDLIDDKLVIVEALNLGLDKEKELVDDINIFKLNVFLTELKKNEIDGKVKDITAEELFAYMLSEFKKNIDAKRSEDKEGAEKADKELESLKYEDVPITAKETYRKKLLAIKLVEREKEFFSNLRKGASVKIYKKALEGLVVSDIGTLDVVLAKGDAGEIKGYDLWSLGLRDPDAAYNVKLEILERAILYKLLDKEALSRGYEKLPEISSAIDRYSQKKTIEYFKKKIIYPMVKVTAEDVEKYYDANKEKYKAADLLNLRAIYVSDKKTADKVIKELKKGGNFGYIANAMSADKISGKKGGDIGWVDTKSVPNELLKDAQKAKKNDILGPYAMYSGGFMIVEYRDRKEGGYTPLDGVSASIQQKLLKDGFDKAFDAYLGRLRSTIPVVINESNLQ